MGSERLAAHMGVSLILFLAAVGGWGAFAYTVSSERQQERFLRDQIAHTAAERERLNAELRQVRAEAEQTRQQLDRTRRDLASSQQQAASLAEQLKARERAAAPAATGAARTPPAPPQPARPAAGPASRP